MLDPQEISPRLSLKDLTTLVHDLLDNSEALEPVRRAEVVGQIMARLDAVVPTDLRIAIMRRRGRQCFLRCTAKPVQPCLQKASDLDDFLRRLNEADIGGGRLAREGDVITAGYDSCPCPTVNAGQEPISGTYCQCSCGWYASLFEAYVGHPVTVTLVDSIAQGADRCTFTIDVE